jgi:hypothetical protein
MTVMDPENPVVLLCAEGMRAESAGRAADAAALFERPWAARTDAFEACIAAHYVARHQPSPEDTLHWNREALAHADAVRDRSVAGFYPSLYLNLAHSFEVLGDTVPARRCYSLARERLTHLAAGDAYGDLVRRGISEGMARMADGERSTNTG